MTTEFEPAFQFNIPDLGWSGSRDTPDILDLIRPADAPGSLDFLHVTSVIQSPCGPSPEETASPPTASDLLAQLGALSVPGGHLTLGELKTVTVGGVEGRQVDVGVADGALAACGGLAGGDVSIFAAGDQVWGAASGERFRLVALTVEGQPVTILISTDWTTIPSVQQLEDMFNRGRQILDTVVFEAVPAGSPTP